MAIKDIEDSIKSLLKENFSGLSVESFPENFSDYLDKFSHPVGAILLNYKGSSFSSPETLNFVVQNDKTDFSAIILIRAAKSEAVYPYIEQLKQILTGYKMPGCDKVFISKISFLDEIYGKFIYVVDFSTITKLVEAVPAETNALLKKITNVNNFGEVTEVISNNV